MCMYCYISIYIYIYIHYMCVTSMYICVKVTRQQMIEYLSLMKWSRTSCRLAPLAIALWLILLVVVAVRAHTEASFRVREAISTSLLNITADRSRGEAPARIFTESTANKVSCKCSCAYERGAALSRRVFLCSGGATCLTLLVQRVLSSKVANHAANCIICIRQVMP